MYIFAWPGLELYCEKYLLEVANCEDIECQVLTWRV